MPVQTEMIPSNSTSTYAFVLGQTQEQRGSEIQSGARAELTPSPLTLALSSLRGRIVAQTMFYTINNKAALNFTAARVPLLKHSILRAIAPTISMPVIVELAVGFSPLTILLAEALPQGLIIEIDTPWVLTRRYQRLRKLENYDLPDNLRSYGANLGKEPLHSVLGGYRPDIITFTGAYFKPEQLTQISEYLYNLLNPGGALVTYIPWLPGILEVQAAMRFFKQEVGDVAGATDNETHLRKIFTAAGFQPEVYYPSQLVSEFPLASPVLDIEILLVARKPLSTASATKF